jgi:hypothetical protein
LEKLFQELSEEEQQIFTFDVKNIEWHDYIGNVHIPGLRQHVMRGRGTGKPLIKISSNESFEGQYLGSPISLN